MEFDAPDAFPMRIEIFQNGRSARSHHEKTPARRGPSHPLEELRSLRVDARHPLYGPAATSSLFRRRGIISPELICRLYGVSAADILGVVYFEPAWAVKITMRRPVVSGSPGDSDVYGAQQHAPLLDIEFDE